MNKGQAHFVVLLNKPIYLLFFIVFSVINHGYAQYNHVWTFGINAGLDFNSGAPTPFVANIGNNDIHGEANATICDENGVLLFYTEGTRILNRQHRIMPNGNNLVPFASVTTYTATTSTSQGTLIIPVPGAREKYYVFSLTSFEQASANNWGRLFYSIVDISLDNGLGDVIANQKGIPLDSNLSERMTAVAGDACNIWLLTINRNNQLKAWEITASGIKKAPILSDIKGLRPFDYPAGLMVASGDGRKIAVTQTPNSLWDAGSEGLILLDFDVSSGKLSSQFVFSNVKKAYGICFSPDNTKLYCQEPIGIHQFDLTSGIPANIINSKIRIAQCGLYESLKLGPDQKIYFAAASSIGLSTINFPNLSGIASQPQYGWISLSGGTIFQFGFPNIIPPYIEHPDTIISAHTICKSSNVQLTLIPDDTTGWDYRWSNNRTSSTNTVTIPGVYWVSYFTSCRFHIDTFKVSILPVQEITKVICSDDYYDFNGERLDKAGIYIDTFKNEYGCDSVLRLTLIVAPSPELVLHLDNNLDHCLGDTIQLRAEGGQKYKWYYNGELQNNEQGTFSLATRHTTTLYVEVSTVNEYDCSVTEGMPIILDVCCDIFIPNAFSPNNDGNNDRFAPLSRGNLLEYRIQIFNRWGQLIFSSFDMGNGWDGTYKGTSADIGTYFYYITARCFDGTEIIRKGEAILVK